MYTRIAQFGLETLNGPIIMGSDEKTAKLISGGNAPTVETNFCMPF